MEYTKISNEKYNIHFIKTDKFKKNIISIQFREKVNKKNITKRNLLSKVLLKSTQSLKDEREINIKSEELYNVIYNSYLFISGKHSVLGFDLTLLNPKYTEISMLDESFNFIFDIILKPDTVNNQFKKNKLKLAKEELKEEINYELESSRAKATRKLYEIMSPSTTLSINNKGYIEDFNKINTKNLYQYYIKTLQENNIDIFVIGDFNQNKIEDIIKDKLGFTSNKSTIKDSYYKIYKIKDNKEESLIKESSTFNQSILCLGFKLNKLTKFEKNYVSLVYNFILGDSPESKLFKNVREKHSMCYNIRSRILASFNVMTITSGIDRVNNNKALDLIKEELNNMKIGNFNDEDINNAKKAYTNEVISSIDSPNGIMSQYMSKEYLNKDLMEDKINNIKKVTKKDLIKFTNKIKLDTIFLLEGNGNNE